MEKRKFLRQALGIEATYRLTGGENVTGIIEDFSQDGLFITFGDLDQSDNKQHGHIRLGITMDIQVPVDGNVISIPATLVHLADNGMGVTYIGNKFRAYQYLVKARQQTASADEGASQVAVEQRLNSESQRISVVNACNAQLKEYMDETLREYFDTLEDNLLNEAGKQKNDAAQHPYMDAVAQFKRQRKSLPDIITGKIMADAQDIIHGRYKAANNTHPGTSSADQSLSLVDKSDFEGWLTVRVVISRAELQLREPLIELQLRLDAAFGKDDGKRLTNPYSPAMITHALQGSIHTFRLNTAIERQVFRLFQTIVLNHLARLYRTINTIFIKHGILPDIDITRYLAAEALKKNRASQDTSPKGPEEETKPLAINEIKPPNLPAGTVSTAPYSPASGIAQGTAGPVSTGSSMQTLREGLERARNAYSSATRLMQLQRDKQADSAIARQEKPITIPDPQAVQQTLRTLDVVQRQIIDNAIDLNTPGSLVRHMETMSNQDGGGLTDQEKESAVMVENLFTNIVDHKRIVDDLKPEMRKLEVPILKVLLQDPRLFSSEYHPARQFINFVALLADKESANLNSNRPSILDSIQIVLTSPSPGNEPFEQGLDRLDKVVEREKKIIERNLARVTEACEGQQRVQLANNHVEMELAERLRGKNIPKKFNDLLAGAWKDLMRLCYLREGMDSRAWEMTLVVVDQLIIRLVPGEYDEGKLLFKQEELKKLIEKGLSKVPDTKGRNAENLSQISSLLEEGVLPDTEMTVYQPAVRQSQPPFQVASSESEDKELQRWVARARKLKEGQWLEFDATLDSTHLYQVAWISEHQERFVFVNHHGVKVADLSLEEISLKLKSGEVVVLSDAVLPAVENGLDTLVQKIYDQLALESAHDQLTGMKTRKEFERCLAQSVARAKQHNIKHTLIYLDIVQFKIINNTCGYEAGDNLLREIGSRFRSSLPGNAISGRLGGNEFGVIVSVETDQQGFQVATDLKSSIEQNRFVAGGQSFVIEVVCSMLTFDSSNDQVLELLRSTESAVAIAKKSGHKEIQVVKPGDSRIEERDEVMGWVARINRALDLNILKLRCQIIAPLDEDIGSLPHYEILLTVVDENGEHLPPADFIRAAEEYSRMAAVDRWVIETVLRWMTKNQDYLDHFGGFSINLSGHSMNDDSFLDFMFENLVRYGVPRDKLIFEVTETTAVANLEDAADFISEMRGIGCRFSLDDFGAGQSSYAYLKKLPVDFIKIDGAFVRNIAEDDVDYAMVKSITEMGHFLNKKIIAEYVSDMDILEVVKDIGVDYAQGYYLGKPCFIEELNPVADKTK